jgi:hypothetical protein
VSKRANAQNGKNGKYSENPKAVENIRIGNNIRRLAFGVGTENQLVIEWHSKL